MMDIEYDAEVNILSFRFSKNKVIDSRVQDGCAVEYDKDGNIVYMEFLDVSPKKIKTVFGYKHLSNFF